jgi:hypothetical protein
LRSARPENAPDQPDHLVPEAGLNAIGRERDLVAAILPRSPSQVDEDESINSVAK